MAKLCKSGINSKTKIKSIENIHIVNKIVFECIATLTVNLAWLGLREAQGGYNNLCVNYHHGDWSSADDITI